MYDTFTQESLHNALEVLQRNASPSYSERDPLLIFTTPGRAEQVASSFGVELSLDKNGEQQVGMYKIITRRPTIVDSFTYTRPTERQQRGDNPKGDE